MSTSIAWSVRLIISINVLQVQKKKENKIGKIISLPISYWLCLHGWRLGLVRVKGTTSASHALNNNNYLTSEDENGVQWAWARVWNYVFHSKMIVWCLRVDLISWFTRLSARSTIYQDIWMLFFRLLSFFLLFLLVFCCLLVYPGLALDVFDKYLLIVRLLGRSALAATYNFRIPSSIIGLLELDEPQTTNRNSDATIVTIEKS